MSTTGTPTITAGEGRFQRRDRGRDVRAERDAVEDCERSWQESM
jgi:hypothetical protein